ncbi:MAG: NADH-quinone oxidoreductase subunit NuoN [Micavibrio aeruginosavorus]|uniref:NADH-quinone oxidoreductase subunit N n=1 Tax=Micavibrio aeruginosavorus TaxID=349221 RepID=A0A7T5UGG7_9BACT|nr:MAG: NADH-quinone oxidoreductase subunit NuoN [Micavibrio aeruginosavorus]
MNNFNPVEFSAVFPELFMAVAAMVLLVAGAVRGNGLTAFISWSVLATFAITAMFLLGIDWDSRTVMGDMFRMNPFTGFIKLLILAGLGATTALSVRYLYEEAMARFEYPILILLAGLGMMIMVSANNLLTLYVGLELQSLSLYVLAAFRRDNARSSEAGLKYFVLGALASGMLLFGVSLVYGFAGTIDYSAIGGSLATFDGMPVGFMVGMVFVLVGIAFKISAVPFHMWTPDVYEGAPTSVTAFFALVPKIAAIAVLMQLLYGPFGGLSAHWQQIIWFLAVASMIWSALAGLVQNNIKRLMAYSSIGNMGYALVGLITGTPQGASAVVVYMTIYMIMTAGVFAIIMCMRRGERAVESIDDLAGLSRTSPLLAYAMAILLFSMSGIPPLAGFFGKLLVFQAAIGQGFYTLAVIGVICSVVAAYYYLRIIKVMFFDEAAEPFDRQMAFAKRAVIALSVIFVLFFILKPNMLVDTARHTASALFSG